MKKQRRIANIWKAQLVLLLGIVLSAAGDEVGRGGSAGSFLRMGLGARALGLGGGLTALADDGSVSYYNPAGLVYLEERWVTASLSVMPLDRRMTYVGYAQSFGKQGPGLPRVGFSVGWMSAGVSRIDARDFSGQPTGSLSFEENCFFFSFSLSPYEPVALGFSGKLLYSRFPGITDTGEALSAVGFGFDIGIMARPHPMFSLGVAVRDLRSRYTWDTQKLWERGTQKADHFPVTVQAGAAARLWKGRITLGADVEKVNYRPVYFGAGVELSPVSGLRVRGGIRDGALVMGGGYTWKVAGRMLNLDYAWNPDSVAPGDNHVFTFSFLL
jgi:hypothetical protein